MGGNQYECPGRSGRNRPEHRDYDQYTMPQLLLKTAEERDDVLVLTTQGF
jgi:hypothetical protein